MVEEGRRRTQKVASDDIKLNGSKGLGARSRAVPFPLAVVTGVHLGPGERGSPCTCACFVPALHLFVLYVCVCLFVPVLSSLLPATSK